MPINIFQKIELSHLIILIMDLITENLLDHVLGFNYLILIF